MPEGWTRVPMVTPPTRQEETRARSLSSLANLSFARRGTGIEREAR